MATLLSLAYIIVWLFLQTYSQYTTCGFFYSVSDEVAASQSASSASLYLFHPSFCWLLIVMTGATLRSFALKHILGSSVANFSGKSEVFSYAYRSHSMRSKVLVQGSLSRPLSIRASEHCSGRSGNKQGLPMLR